MKEQNLVEDHRTMKEGEIAPLDALYPTMRETPQDVCHARDYLPGGREARDLPGGQELCQEHDAECSTSPERSSNTDHNSSPDDHDPYKDEEQEGHKKIKMITFAMEGEEGHN